MALKLVSGYTTTMRSDSVSQSISISAGTIFKAILIVLFFVFLYIIRDLVLVLLTAVILAASIEPATRWFGRYHVPRIPAVIAIYILVALSFSSVFFLFIPPLLDETTGIISFFSGQLETLNTTSVSGLFGSDLFGNISETIPFSDLASNIKNIITGVSGGVFGLISSIFGGLLSFILIVVISFYLAVQERGIENFLKIVTPIKHEPYMLDLWKRSQQKIGRWMQGQLLLGVLIGVLVYLGLTIIGVKYALLLALIAAMFELIPLFGPILAATPAVILGFLEGFVPGFMVLGLYIIIQQFENHLIYPLVVRKVVGVPPLVVIIALIIGAKLAGFLGLLLAAPLAAVLMEYMNDLEKKKHHHRPQASAVNQN